MNERIEKLLEQCQIETYGVNGELLEIGVDAEKFAELIVKDCSCVPTDMWGAGELDVHTAVQVHRQILKHFGIEE